MDFASFARAHGVVINRLVEDGRWHRVTTTDKPHHKNGAYKFLGDYGLVQNWASMTEPDLWRPDGDGPADVDHEAIARRAKQAADEIRRGQEAAAKRAGWILHQCTTGPHPYLAAKGFPEDRGRLWEDEKAGDVKLCIPMQADGKVVGLQTISDAPGFEKKFLYGQRTSEAVYVIDNRGQRADAPTLFAEGYCTGLSAAAAMHSLKLRFRLIICFTAGNMLKVARNHGTGLVIADNDNPSQLAPEPGGMGLKVAKEIGLPYWLSDRIGEDANDYHAREGLFRLSQSLKAAFFIRRQG